MSLEFAVQYDCPLRANYSEQHLRQWGRLSSLHAKLTTGDAVAPTVDKLQWVEQASAELAARGLSNRDVAQALFVTVKTVEMHLGRAYRKLGIGSRGELAEALAASAPSPSR